MSNFNNLVIYVIQAKGIQSKGQKVPEVYVSLTTVGKSKWKSKVSTNSVKPDDGCCKWEEHCEFEISDADSEMHIHVNCKTIFGTTELLGQVVFGVEQMARYQPPTWFRLVKRANDTKERGFIQLEYQFANKFGSSISNMSLNKIEKEKKFDKLKRKMNLIGRSKKAVPDDQSMASVAMSRRSSFSSNASALAFSSPSPNHMNSMISTPENFLSQQSPFSAAKDNSKELLDQLNASPFERESAVTSSLYNDSIQGSNNPFNSPQISIQQSVDNNNRLSKVSRKNCLLEFDALSVPSADGGEVSKNNVATKVRQRAEQLLHLRQHKKHTSDPSDELSGGEYANYRTDNGGLTGASRPNSIASSSGFASLSSNNLGALNENTSPEHLLNVIKHLRRELLAKDNRIRDLEQYTDKLLSKIILTHPELLQVSPQRR